MGPANTYRTNNVENNVIKLVVNLVHLLYYYIQYYFYKRELISKALKYRVLRSRRINYIGVHNMSRIIQNTITGDMYEVKQIFDDGWYIIEMYDDNVLVSTSTGIYKEVISV